MNSLYDQPFIRQVAFSPNALNPSSQMGSTDGMGSADISTFVLASEPLDISIAPQCDPAKRQHAKKSS